MRKSKIVYREDSQERELIIPQELLFDFEKKEKFIKDHIGNIDYTEYRYYDESDDDIDSLPEQISDVTDNTSENSEPVSELPPTITEVPDTSLADSDSPSIETLTAEIKMYLHIANQSIIEVGKRLIQAKELVPHGEWANWLKHNFNLKRQMAQNFMKVAERFEKNESDSNYQTFGNFDISTFKPSQLIELLALPEGEEQNFIEQKAAEGNPADKMTIKQLRSEVKKFSADLAKLSKERESFQLENIHLNGKLNYLEEQLTIKQNLMNGVGESNVRLNKEVSELKAQLEQRPTVEVPPPDYEDLQREFQELRNRPIEVATEFPPDYESTKHELAELKKREDSFKNDYALIHALNQFFSLIPTLLNSDNLQSVVNSCADDNLQIFETQISQLSTFLSLLQQHLNTWKDDPANKLPIDRNSITQELMNICQADSTNSVSRQFRQIILDLGFNELKEIPDDMLPLLLKKTRTLKP